MAKEKLTKNEIYTELEEDVIDFFKERLDNLNIPIDINFYFQSNKKLKQLVKLTKIPDQYSVILNKDILVQINCEYFDSFRTEDETINVILFDQCLDLINYDLEKGTFKIGKSNFSASEGIIDKYSYTNVQRAIELQRLYEEQKKDKEQN